MPTYQYKQLQVFRPNPTTERRQVYTDNVMMTIVDFQGGPSPAAPPHAHPHEQVTYVALGPINFYIEQNGKQEVTRLETGDLFIAPGNAPHTVEVLGKTARLIDCFYPIREDFLK